MCAFGADLNCDRIRIFDLNRRACIRGRKLYIALPAAAANNGKEGTALDRRRKYGRKIKKTKNLYRKKRSAGQKVFGTIMLVVAAAAIAFLGFCIGKPLLDYIGNIGKDEPAEWTPEASYSARSETAPADPPSDTAEPAEVTESTLLPTDSEVSGVSETADTKQPHSTSVPVESSDTSLAPVSYDALISMEAPASALSNSASLSAVIAKAKSGGYNSVVIQLKDKNGYFRYKTAIESIADTDLVTGTMTLEEIMRVFTENNMVPIAEIAVLADEKGCETFTDMSYKCLDAPDTSWLDYSERPPRRWANPDKDATREYFANITTEFAAAGFEHILLTDVVFPNFQNYDTAYIAAKYFAPERYKMLYNVVKTGNIIEMKASDVIGDEFGRTAEVLNDTSQLRNNKIALIISRSDLPTDSGYPADAKALVETVLSLAEKKAGGLAIVPVIDGSGFDDAEKSKITAALAVLGYESFIMR